MFFIAIHRTYSATSQLTDKAMRYHLSDDWHFTTRRISIRTPVQPSTTWHLTVMKIYDLCCAVDRFEGYFSEEDFFRKTGNN